MTIFMQKKGKEIKKEFKQSAKAHLKAYINTKHTIFHFDLNTLSGEE